MERYTVGTNGMVISETLQNGKELQIRFKEWNGSRYYVTRDNEQIGWIATDLSKCQGKTSTNEHYLNLMIKAMKAVK